MSAFGTEKEHSKKRKEFPFHKLNHRERGSHILVFMNADDEVKGKMRAKNVALYDCIIMKKKRTHGRLPIPKSGFIFL